MTAVSHSLEGMYYHYYNGLLHKFNSCDIIRIHIIPPSQDP